MAKSIYQRGAAARARGRPKIGPGPEADRAARLYAEGYSLREVGKAMKIDQGAVRRRLKAAGVIVRVKARAPSRFRRLDQAKLFGAIAAFGVRETAAKWKLSERNLYTYLARLRGELEGHR